MTDLLPRLFIRDYRNTENPKVRAAYGTLSGIVGIIRSDTRGSNISPR